MKKHKNAWVLFLLPSMIGVSIFVLLPFLGVIIDSFGLGSMKGASVGGNYALVLQNEAFRLAVRNTARFALVCIPLLIVFSFLVALLIEKSPLMHFLKSTLLLPLAVPSATLVFIWKMFFDKQGIGNLLLSQLGIASIDFMETGAAFWVLVFSYIWKNLGYTVILWLGGMAMIPDSILEAAKVDGADSKQCLFYIIMPNLKATLYMITVLSFLNSFKVFREAYLVAGSYPNENIYLLQHLFNNWFVTVLRGILEFHSHGGFDSCRTDACGCPSGMGLWQL